ncbi:MAG: GHKL domain-containing protein [Lachnospiraceae bacterium]|nr:GHKL domain-containing protein [Lachnospiraceae bacterium]
MIEIFLTWIHAIFPPFLMALADQLGCVFFVDSADRNYYQRGDGSWLLLISIFCSILFQRGGGLALNLYVMLALKGLFYYIFIYLWTRRSILVCLYSTMIYFLISDCMQTLFSFFSQTILGYDVFLNGTLIAMLAANLVEAVCLFLIIRAVRSVMKRGGIPVLRYAQIPILAVALLPYLFIRGIVFWLPVSNEDLRAETPVMLIITFLVGLLLIIGNVNMISSQRHSFELQQMEQMLAAQHAQFNQSREMEERINHSYHDLKNTLLYLQADTDQEEIRRRLGEMMRQILPYESELQTGNQAVDVIMNQKLSICLENGIRCVPYLDGTLLDFMDPLDICTILGNAMDNAIEACLQIPEEETRQIQMKAVKRIQMLCLRFSNSCLEAPKEQDGQLLSTKKDSEMHGFGIRSMRRVAEKYDGSLTCKMDNDQFVLDILIPFPEGTKA